MDALACFIGSRVRFIEDLHGLRAQWQQLKSTFDVFGRTVADGTMLVAGGSTSTLADVLAHFGQNVRRSAIAETSENLHRYLRDRLNQ